MTDGSYISGGEEDLPRTVRQQKEARARDQLAREMSNAPRQGFARAAQPGIGAAMGSQMTGDYADAAQYPPGAYDTATVTRLKLPFVHLVGFFLKAVLAAIPALVLLLLILYALGQIAQTYLPWLVKMKILITFPG